MQTIDVLIVGGGVIGTSCAYELSQYKLKVALLEKNAFLGCETSQANSGVIHSGIDPNPNKLTAKYNILGRKIWIEDWFKKLIFPRKKIATLIVAFNNEEKLQLNLLKERGIKNSIPVENIQILDQQQTLLQEPFINPNVVASLKVEGSWLIDPLIATKCLALASLQNNVAIYSNKKVTKIEIDSDDDFLVFINNETTPQFKTKKLIDAAGHYADWLAETTQVDNFKQTTRKGQYLVLKNQNNLKINTIIFMVPTIHGKGVVVAEMLDGNILVGPNAVEGIEKNKTRSIELDSINQIKTIGKKMVPSLQFENSIYSFAGSRAIDIETNDFVIRTAKSNPNFIILGGMKSPGLTSSPAIAKRAVELLNLKLKKKINWNPNYNLSWI